MEIPNLNIEKKLWNLGYNVFMEQELTYREENERIADQIISSTEVHPSYVVMPYLREDVANIVGHERWEAELSGERFNVELVSEGISQALSESPLNLDE